ncbi:adenylate/guanylate cyclase domain-containing protein [Candidatus Riflebacteria bacterium]
MGNRKRFLKAILFSDIKSFSAMMGKDEEKTVDLVAEHRQLFRKFLQKYGGKEKGTSGDSFFVLFDSSVNAVQCAIEIQESFLAKNQNLEQEEQVWIRIGLNAGDIIFEEKENDVFGEAVNIAARVEPLAPVGGICLTEAVFRDVKNKITRPFKSLGKKVLKNIKQPPLLYQLSFTGNLPDAMEMHDDSEINRGLEYFFYTLAVLSFLLAGLVVFEQQKTIQKKFTQLKVRKNPHVLVLPFKNLTAAPEDNWLSVGLAESIELKLSAISGVRLIPFRQLQLENTKDAIKEAAKRGMDFVVHGSFQKVNRVIKILAKIEYLQKKYENPIFIEKRGEFEKIFDLQDAIAVKLALVFKGKKELRDLKKIKQTGTRNIPALKSYSEGVRLLTKGKAIESMQRFCETLKQDPGFNAAKNHLNQVMAVAEYTRLHRDGRISNRTITQVLPENNGKSFSWSTNQKITGAWDRNGNKLKIIAGKKLGGSWKYKLVFPKPIKSSKAVEIIYEYVAHSRIISVKGIKLFSSHTINSVPEEKNFVIEIPMQAKIISLIPPYDFSLKERNRRFFIIRQKRKAFGLFAWIILFAYQEDKKEQFLALNSRQQFNFFREDEKAIGKKRLSKTFIEYLEISDPVRIYTLLKQGSVAEAEAILKKMGREKRELDNFLLPWVESYFFAQKSDFEKAILSMKKALRAENRPRLLLDQSFRDYLAYCKTASYGEEMLELMQSQMNRFPWLEKSFFYKTNKERGEQGDIFAQRFRLDRENPAAVYDLALLYEKNGSLENAYRTLDRLREEKRNFYHHFLAGKIAVQKKDLIAAEKHFLELSGWFSTFMAWVRHCRMLIRSNRPDEAFELCLNELRGKETIQSSYKKFYGFEILKSAVPNLINPLQKIAALNKLFAKIPPHDFGKRYRLEHIVNFLPSVKQKFPEKEKWIQWLFTEIKAHIEKDLSIKALSKYELNRIVTYFMGTRSMARGDKNWLCLLAQRAAELDGYKSKQVLGNLKNCYIAAGKLAEAEKIKKKLASAEDNVASINLKGQNGK